MTVGQWLQAQVQWRTELSSWLGVSMLLYFFCANLSWIVDRTIQRVRGTGIRPLRAQAGRYWLLDILRWVYMIGPPYLMLVSGLMSPTQIGLVELDWVGAAHRGGILVPITLILLVIGWRSFLHLAPRRLSEETHGRDSLPIICVASAAEAAALQMHWAFYRAAATSSPWIRDPYWGAWLGATLILVQWGLNAWVWRSPQSAEEGDTAARRGAMLFVTIALFLVTGNIWLCWFVHAAFEFFARWLTRSVRVNGEE